MTTGLPLGAFTRGRRDWSIEQLMVGSVWYVPCPLATAFSLGNYSLRGNYLAVYGLLAFKSSAPPWMVAWVAPGYLTTATGVPFVKIGPLIAGFPAIDGTLGLQSNGAYGVQHEGLSFAANGIDWLTLGDVPIFVIPPGSSLFVRIQPIANYPTQLDAMGVTFVWGYHTGARPPKTQHGVTPPPV